MKKQNSNNFNLLRDNLLLRHTIAEYKWRSDLLSEISQAMDSIVSEDELAVFFVGKLSELFKAGKVSFMLLDESKGELFIRASQGLRPEIAQVRAKLDDGFSGQVVRKGTPLLVKDIEAEFPLQFSKNRLSRYLTKSFLIVPVKMHNNIIGVVSLTDRKDENTFSDLDLKMLNLVTQYFAWHIENIRLLERNKNLAISDPLTGLYNHRYFHEQLLEEIYRTERYNRALSIIILDIDKFSAYNQEHGYSAGDNVLQQIGKIIKDNTRQIDFASRYGSEEFAIILPETRLKDAIFVGEKIRERIAGAVFTDDAQKRSPLGMSRLTVSVGVAEHRVGLTKEELIQRVQSALSEAKKKGKNRVLAFK